MPDQGKQSNQPTICFTICLFIPTTSDTNQSLSALLSVPIGTVAYPCASSISNKFQAKIIFIKHRPRGLSSAYITQRDRGPRCSWSLSLRVSGVIQHIALKTSYRTLEAKQREGSDATECAHAAAGCSRSLHHSGSFYALPIYSGAYIHVPSH